MYVNNKYLHHKMIDQPNVLEISSLLQLDDEEGFSKSMLVNRSIVSMRVVDARSYYGLMMMDM